MPLLIIIVILSALVIGFGSQKFLGKDNVVEQVAEEVIDRELDLPDGTVQLPFIWEDKPS